MPISEGSTPASTILAQAVQNAALRRNAKGHLVTGYKPLLACSEIAIPYLVAHAKQHMLVSYEQVSKITGLNTARLGNRSFGVIGQVRNLLKGPGGSNSQWNDIPDLTSIVQHKNDDMSGSGAFHSTPELLREPRSIQLQDLKRRRNAVFKYPHWDAYLQALELPSWDDLTPESVRKHLFHASGGEGELHRKLKAFVRNHPRLIHGSLQDNSGAVEYTFLSDDRMDVSFRTATKWIGTEIKTSEANSDELTRGIFQVIKYRTLMESTLRMRAEDVKVDCILALGGEPPAEILHLAARLGVPLKANLEAKMGTSA